MAGTAGSLEQARRGSIGPDRLRRIGTKLKISLGIIGGLALVCAAVGMLLALRAVQDRVNNSPSEVEPGADFRHDGFVVESGWEVTERDGDFAIDGLTIKNPSLRVRSAYLEFTVYRDREVIAYISCSRALGPRESATASCFSADDYDEDFDEVRVSDTF